MTRPQLGRTLWIGVVVLWLLAAVIYALHGQVAPTIELKNGAVTTLVRNPSREPQRITIELRERLVGNNVVTTGRVIRALVAPASLVLEPGATQTVRIRLKEPVAAGTILGLCTTFTPTSADAPARVRVNRRGALRPDHAARDESAGVAMRRPRLPLRVQRAWRRLLRPLLRVPSEEPWCRRPRPIRRDINVGTTVIRVRL